MEIPQEARFVFFGSSVSLETAQRALRGWLAGRFSGCAVASIGLPGQPLPREIAAQPSLGLGTTALARTVVRNDVEAVAFGDAHDPHVIDSAVAIASMKRIVVGAAAMVAQDPRGVLTSLLVGPCPDLVYVDVEKATADSLRPAVPA